MTHEYIQKLKSIQGVSKLTQSKIADLLEVSFPTLNSWWNNKSTPRKNALKKIDVLYRKYCDLKQEEDATVKEEYSGSILNQILANKGILESLIVRITYHTDAIEGSTLSEKETALVVLENQNLPDKTLIEQLEAKNHKSALIYLFTHLKNNGGIDEDLAKKLHSILMNSILDTAGSYRFHNVRIAGSNVVTSNYIKVPELMRELFSRSLPQDKDDVILFAAKFHADFEKIHPFLDGNGRIGRLLLNAMLISRDAYPAIIEKEKKLAYYDALEKAQNTGDYTDIETFIASSIEEGRKFLSI